MPKMEKTPPVARRAISPVRGRLSRRRLRRLTFGYPCLYVGGNMVSGLFRIQAWYVKLGADARIRATAASGARAVRTDARPADDRLHPPAACRSSRMTRRSAPGSGGRSLWGDDAAKGAEAEEAEVDKGAEGRRCPTSTGTTRSRRSHPLSDDVSRTTGWSSRSPTTSRPARSTAPGSTVPACGPTRSATSRISPGSRSWRRRTSPTRRPTGRCSASTSAPRPMPSCASRRPAGRPAGRCGSA